jgi:two-component system LytT family response regulator
MNNENLVNVGGRMKFCPSEIILLESDNNYTRLHFADGKIFLTSTNLGKLEPRFISFNFFRPNRSCIINLDFMTNYEKETGSIKMENNETIQISRRRIKPFINITNQYFNQISILRPFVVERIEYGESQNP